MVDTRHQPLHNVQRQHATKTSRWLLPFTFGLDMCAINCVMRLAENAGALLVAVSLISTSPRGGRLEYLQQSQDFLEATQQLAVRFQVPVERYEVYTANPLQSLTMLVQETCCEGIVLVTGQQQNRLLQDEEIEYLLVNPPTALVLIRLSSSTVNPLSSLPLASRFLSWWRGLWRQQDVAQQHQQEALSKEEPLWIRTERHLQGYPVSAVKKEVS